MRWFFIICVLVTGLHGSPDAHAHDITELRARADQGATTAQYFLGVRYDNGQGVVQNYVQAHKRFNRAAANSTGETPEDAAGNRSIVEKKMTPQQVAEAQRLAGEWLVRQP